MIPKKIEVTEEMSAYNIAHSILTYLTKAESYGALDVVFIRVNKLAIREEDSVLAKLGRLEEAAKACFIDVNSSRGTPDMHAYIAHGLYNTLTDVATMHSNPKLIAEIYLGFYVNKDGSMYGDETIGKPTLLAIAIEQFIRSYWED
jgi:hypothetical protein